MKTISIFGLIHLCWGFTAQSTKWGHVKRDQFTLSHIYWAGLVLHVVNQYYADSFTRNWQLPSWISGRERMTIENISWSISMKNCCKLSGGQSHNLLITSQTHIIFQLKNVPCLELSLGFLYFTTPFLLTSGSSLILNDTQLWSFLCHYFCCHLLKSCLKFKAINLQLFCITEYRRIIRGKINFSLNTRMSVFIGIEPLINIQHVLLYRMKCRF